MGSSCCSFPASAARQFGASLAEGDLQRYRRKGPGTTTRRLRDEIVRLGGGDTVLDVGAGIGALSFELLATGSQHAVAVDASPAYAAAVRQEAQRRGCSARLEVHEGDFVALDSGLPEADVVALDRVICCYPAFQPLLSAALAHSRRLVACSYPHDRWYIRLVVALQNAMRAMRGNDFRTFVHPTRQIEALAQTAGYRRAASRSTLVWSIVVLAREG